MIFLFLILLNISILNILSEQDKVNNVFSYKYLLISKSTLIHIINFNETKFQNRSILAARNSKKDK